MWDAAINTFEGGRVRRVEILCAGAPVSYAEAIDRWQHDATFLAFFTGILSDAPFDAHLWETPPITRATVSRNFEFALIESVALERMAVDPGPFSQQFRTAGPDADVTAFANLGGDAFLIAPCPATSHEDALPLDVYAHLAAFTRAAPFDRQSAFWRLVGACLDERLADRPLWLSTSGLGVAWLHARIDTSPKYYTFDPYRTYA